MNMIAKKLKIIQCILDLIDQDWISIDIHSVDGHTISLTYTPEKIQTKTTRGSSFKIEIKCDEEGLLYAMDMGVKKESIKNGLIRLLRNFQISTIDVWCPDGEFKLRSTNGKSVDKFLMECKMTSQQLANFRIQQAYINLLKQ